MESLSNSIALTLNLLRLNSMPLKVNLYSCCAKLMILNSLAKRICDIIGERLKLQHETVAPFEYFGLLTEYNGVDATQNRGRINESYIRHVLKTLGWEVEGNSNADQSSSSARTVPMSPDDHAQAYADVGHPEGTIEYADLPTKMGVALRSLLTSRVDLSSVVRSSHFTIC
jgi:hypothetical protein